MASDIPSASGSGDMPFIVATSMKKIDATSRKFIRSHVMRGKNRRKQVVRVHQEQPVLDRDPGPTRSLADLRRSQQPYSYAAIPQAVGNTLALTQFADEMQPYMRELILKFFTVVKDSMYPIELCLLSDPRESVWFEYLTVDTCYLHSVLWMTQTYFDSFTGRPHSPTALVHAYKTLRLLRQRLNECSSIVISDATIFVVIILVMTTCVLGDISAARKHMDGLYQMVMLRGGVEFLRDNPQLQLKVCRADLGVALITGTQPRFLPGSISWEPCLANYRSLTSTGLRVFPAGIDRRLLDIWADLQDFSASVNTAFRADQRISPALFREVLISSQYRLLHLDFNAGSIDEIIRIGLLAYSTNVFLQAYGIKVNYAILGGRLRDTLASSDVVWAQSDRGLLIWVLLVTEIAGFYDESGVWLKLRLADAIAAEEMSWAALQSRMKSLLWIDSLHDNAGKEIFDCTSRLATHGSEIPGTV